MYYLYYKVLTRELQLLLLIYKDLASRSIDRKLNLENFRLFFEKNGLWGEKLFKEFDYDESNLIDSDEFVRGIGIFFLKYSSDF